MDTKSHIPILDGPLITQVNLVDIVTRTRLGPFFGESLPGHLIHLVKAGRVVQDAGGVQEKFGPGDSIWYHENEPVSGNILEIPWTFITIAFQAPTLPPPPLDQRVKPITPVVMELGERLLTAWENITAAPALRHMRVHGILLELLTHLVTEEIQTHRLDSAGELWWRTERQARLDLSHPIDLDFLCTFYRRSKRSITRACYLATGKSPMKRIKEIRLSYARGLVQFSEFSITEIAFRVGYNRSQEFSRDFRKAYGVTPTQDRQASPHYKERKIKTRQ